MKKLVLFVSILCLTIPTIFFAQAKPKSSQQYNFTEVWVWTYSNINGDKSEMAIYREPKTNYWLITPDDAGFRDADEMSLWFIVKPNGEVLQAYQNAENINSKPKLIKHQLILNKHTELPKYWMNTGKTRKYGDASMGIPIITGKEYKVNYTKSNDQSTFYIGITKADFESLALFNDLNIDAKLPIRFPTDLPGKYVVLSEYTVFSYGSSVKCDFKYITPTEYYIDLGGF